MVMWEIIMFFLLKNYTGLHQFYILMRFGRLRRANGAVGIYLTWFIITVCFRGRLKRRREVCDG